MSQNLGRVSSYLTTCSVTAIQGKFDILKVGKDLRKRRSSTPPSQLQSTSVLGLLDVGDFSQLTTR